MSSPVPSDISQNDAKVLEKQRKEMQQRHEKEQRSLLWLQEAAEAHHAKRMAQKARREAEAKAKEEAERQRVVEEKKRKKRTREYLQWLWDEVLEEEATLLEGAEGSQVTGSKRKEVTTGDEEEQQPSKKARGKQLGKYYRGATVKIGGSNPCERCVCAGQDCLVHPSRWVINYYTYDYFLIIFFFIVTLLPMLGASHSSNGVYPTPIPTPWP